MISISTSAWTASYQHTTVEVLVSWPIGTSTKTYVGHQNLQRNYPPILHIHPITVHINLAEHTNNYEITLTSQPWGHIDFACEKNRKSHAILFTIFYDETKHVICVVCVLTTN